MLLQIHMHIRVDATIIDDQPLGNVVLLEEGILLLDPLERLINKI